MRSRSKVIISNGFHKFHLAFAAEHLAAKNRLSCLLTAIYPFPWVKSCIEALGLGRRPELRRLIDRKVDVPSELIRSYWLAEVAQHAAGFLSSRDSKYSPESLNYFGMKVYARRATSDVRFLAPRSAIYHYRAGFGGASVHIAKDLGLVTICDHSIAHPFLVERLSRQANEAKSDNGSTLSMFWRTVLEDIERADHVLVNSDFVKETFVLAGVNTSNIHTIYLGIDDEFSRFLSLKDISNVKESRVDSTPEILFAGGFNERKGAFEIIEALKSVEDLNWKFRIAGTVDPEIARVHPDFFCSPRVTVLGWMPRRELAHIMAAADIFLFPSRAEGSARVVFEALASGCYVITTRNAGSIVEDRRHGLIVPSHNAGATSQALTCALTHLEDARRIGKNNAELVRCEFKQAHYGRSLEELYTRVLPEYVS